MQLCHSPNICSCNFMKSWFYIGRGNLCIQEMTVSIYAFCHANFELIKWQKVHLCQLDFHLVKLQNVENTRIVNTYARYFTIRHTKKKLHAKLIILNVRQPTESELFDIIYDRLFLIFNCCLV